MSEKHQNASQTIAGQGLLQGRKAAIRCAVIAGRARPAVPLHKEMVFLENLAQASESLAYADSTTARFALQQNAFPTNFNFATALIAGQGQGPQAAPKPHSGPDFVGVGSIRNRSPGAGPGPHFP